MGLIGNGFLLNRVPGQLIGISQGKDIVAWRGEERFNRMVGGFSETFGGNPSGHLHPAAWTLPIKGGAISARLRDQTGALAIDQLIPALNADSDLAASGDITDANAKMVLFAVAAILGTGTISAANLAGAAGLAASVAGSAAVVAALNAIAKAAAALAGSGAVTAAPTADGSLAADIDVIGATLTTANVGSSVWGALAATFNETGTMGAAQNQATATALLDLAGAVDGESVRELLRGMAAVLLGKSSGAETNTPTYRDLTDAKDRVSATVDANRNRTAVVRDLT
jgi:hypothetical protein